MKSSASTIRRAVRFWMLVALLAVTAAAPAALAQTGPAVPAFSALDAVMQQALARYGVKGGALAVAKDGHLLFARGYGLADAEAQTLVQPDSLFRWGSIAKTLTAAAVVRLVEDGKLDLETPVWNILSQYSPYNGKWGDSRLHNITVRQLLHHTGGWDRDQSGDPMIGDPTANASNATHTSFPPSRDAMIRYMLAQRLDFDPGSRFAYSNFGYMLLGRVIEKVSGQAYEAYVREKVLDPLGLTRIQRGSSHLAGRLPGEVKYYDYPGAPTVNSCVSAAREKQPAPYGLLDMDLNDADGGWIGSVIDLAKFVSMLDGTRPRALFSRQGFASMVAETPRNTWVPGSPNWYGFGLFVVAQMGGITWSHGGAAPGTNTWFYRFANGLCYAFVFNGATQDHAYPNAYTSQPVWDALAAATVWPNDDLFPQYYPPRIAPEGVVNAASFRAGALAPGSLATILGVDLGGQSSDMTVVVNDASGIERPVEVTFSGPGQLNAVLSGELMAGDAKFVVRREGWPAVEVPLRLAAIGPGVFTLNPDGLVAASLVRSKPDLTQIWEPVFQVDADGNIGPKPIVFGADGDYLSLVIYGTGVRGRSSTGMVTVHIGELILPVSYAGPQLQYRGLDQVNVILPRTLAGAGTLSVRVDVDGLTSNTGSLTFQ